MNPSASLRNAFAGPAKSPAPIIATLGLALWAALASLARAGQVQGPGGQAPKLTTWGNFLQGLRNTPQGQALAAQLKIDPNNLDPAFVGVLDQQKGLSPQQLDLTPGAAAPALAAEKAERIGKALDAYTLAATVEAKAALASADSGKIATAQAKLLLLSRIQGRLGNEAQKALGYAQDEYRSAMSADVHAHLQAMVASFLLEGRLNELFAKLGQWRRDLFPTMAFIPTDESDPQKADLWATHASLTKPPPGTGAPRKKAEPPPPTRSAPSAQAPAKHPLAKRGEELARRTLLVADNEIREAIRLVLESGLSPQEQGAELEAFLQSLSRSKEAGGWGLLKSLQRVGNDFYFIDGQHKVYRYAVGSPDLKDLGGEALAPQEVAAKNRQILNSSAFKDMVETLAQGSTSKDEAPTLYLLVEPEGGIHFFDASEAALRSLFKPGAGEDGPSRDRAKHALVALTLRRGASPLIEELRVMEGSLSPTAKQALALALDERNQALLGSVEGSRSGPLPQALWSDFKDPKPGYSDLPAGLWQVLPLAIGQVVELKVGSSDREMATVALSRDETGAVTARLVDTNGTLIAELPLRPGVEATIGRAQENRIQIPSQKVSSNHASLIVFSGEVWARDNLSKNGASATKALDALSAADRLFAELAAARAGSGLMDFPEREAALSRIRRLLRLFGEASRPAAFKSFIGRLMQAGYFAFHNAYFDGEELLTNHLEAGLSRYVAKDSVLEGLRSIEAQSLMPLGLKIADDLKDAGSSQRNALEAKNLEAAASLLAKNRALRPEQRVRWMKAFILNLHGKGFRAGRLRMLGQALFYAHSKEGFYYNGVAGQGPQLPQGSGAEAALDLYFADLAFKAKQGQEISGDDKRDVQQVARALVGLFYPASPEGRLSALSGFYAKLGQAGYFRRDSIEIGPQGLFYTTSNGRVAVYDARANEFVDAPRPKPEELVASQIQTQLAGWLSPSVNREPAGRVVDSRKGEYALILWLNAETGRVLGTEKEFADNPLAAPVEMTYDKDTGKVWKSLFNKKGEVVSPISRQFLGSARGLSFQAQANLAEAISRHNQRP